MSSQDLVNAYLEIQAKNPQAPQQAVEMSEAQVNRFRTQQAEKLITTK